MSLAFRLAIVSSLGANFESLRTVIAVLFECVQSFTYLVSNHNDTVQDDVKVDVAAGGVKVDAGVDIDGLIGMT